MSDEPLLWDLTDSPFCLKVRVCLQLKGVPFRRITASLGRRRELRRLNPLGKVPVLVHGSLVLVDSSAIVRHLDDAYPAPTLRPADPAARAYCDLIEEWADESLYFIVGAFKWLNPQNRRAAWAKTMPELGGGVLRPVLAHGVARSLGRRFRAWGFGSSELPILEDRLRANLETLAGLLGDKAYLLGRTPTLADVAVFAQLAWLRGYVEARLLRHAPVVERWLERLDADPAIATARDVE